MSDIKATSRARTAGTAVGRFQRLAGGVPIGRTCGEFFRYVFVGGFAFVVDFGTLFACQELLFGGRRRGVYLATLLAFAVGHVTNYLLSLRFVFRDPEERRNGWTWKAFGLFAVVGATGVAITELGMLLAHGVLHVNYLLAKAAMAAVVFTWNFIGRKLIVRRK